MLLTFQNSDTAIRPDPELLPNGASARRLASSLHGRPDASKTGSATDNVPPRCEHRLVGRQQVEEQQVGVAPESDGFLRGFSMEYHHPRLDAVGGVIQVPVNGLFLRNLETRV